MDTLISYLNTADSEAAAALTLEKRRRAHQIDLSIPGGAVSAACAAVCAGGGELMRSIAAERAVQLFGCEFAEVRPGSARQAVSTMLAALTGGSGTILTAGSCESVSESGGYTWITVPAGEDAAAALSAACASVKPQVIMTNAPYFTDAESYLPLVKAAEDCGAFLCAELSKAMPLILAGIVDNPMKYCDAAIVSTSGGMLGRQGGIIAARDRHRRKLENEADRRETAGELPDNAAAKAVCLGFAATDLFRDIQHRAVKAAALLSKQLSRYGFEIAPEWNGLAELRLRAHRYNVAADELGRRLAACAIPAGSKFESGDSLALGLYGPAARSMNEDDIKLLARLIRDAAEDFEARKVQIAAETERLCEFRPKKI